MSAHRDDDFTAYVQARLAWLRRVAYLLCQDWQRADDLVQTAITSLYVHWRRSRTMESIDGYARTILVRAFLSERRGGWARRVTLVTHLPDTPEPVCNGIGNLSSTAYRARRHTLMDGSSARLHRSVAGPPSGCAATSSPGNMPRTPGGRWSPTGAVRLSRRPSCSGSRVRCSTAPRPPRPGSPTS